MNVIEAAKAAGWSQTAIDMASKQEMERMERFAQIIRNQTLEEAAKVCDEEAMDERDDHSMRRLEACAREIRALKKNQS